MSPTSIRSSPTALEGIDHRLYENIEKKGGPHGDYLDLLPEGKGWLMAEFGADTQEDALDTRATCDGDAEGQAGRAQHEALHRKGGHGAHLGGTRVRAGCDGLCPRRAATPGRDGRTRRCRRKSSAAYLRDLRALFNKYEYNPALYGHFGQGCIHCRVDFDLTSEPGISKWRSFMEEATDLCVKLRRQLQRRARRRAVARRVSLQDVRRRVDSGVPRIQVHLGPGLEDESGQDGRPLSHRSRTCGWGRTTTRGSRRRISNFPKITAASPTPRCVASASASAAAKRARRRRRHHVPQLHGHARRAAHHPRPRSPSVGDAARRCHRRTAGAMRASRKRSTSASPAKDARAIARSMWTWRRTRRSFCRTIGRAGCGRATPTPLG